MSFDHNRGNFKLQFLVVLLASILTAGLTSYLVLTFMPASQTQPDSDSPELPTLPDIPAGSLGLQEFNQNLVNIAELVKPSVVTVFTERVVKVPRMRFANPFFGAPGFEDFFENFFGPRGRGERGPEANPYDEYRRQGLGSGVIVSDDGFILTNNHVIAEADEIRVRTLDMQTYEAKIIGRDPKTDIAVIKIEASKLRPLKSGSSANLKVGELVLAVGSPMNPNLAHTVTQGIVSAKGRSNVGLADYEDFIQTDAAINPGNSGGALVNIHGQLVGINTAIVSQSGGFQGIGFAVPIDMAHAVMTSLIERGEVVRGWLGVMAQDLTDELVQALGLKNKNGVLISNVEPGSPAEKAGIKAGDVILQINSTPIASGVELRNLISQMSPGTKIDIQLFREGRNRNLSVTLERLKTDEMKPQSAAPQAQEQSSKVLGFRVSPLSDEILNSLKLPPQTEGVVVTEVDQGSSAARAGIREGDVLISVNRKNIANMSEFVEETKNLKKGQSVLLQVLRRGVKIFVAFQA